VASRPCAFWCSVGTLALDRYCLVSLRCLRFLFEFSSLELFLFFRSCGRTPDAELWSRAWVDLFKPPILWFSFTLSESWIFLSFQFVFVFDRAWRKSFSVFFFLFRRQPRLVWTPFLLQFFFFFLDFDGS